MQQTRPALLFRWRGPRPLLAIARTDLHHHLSPEGRGRDTFHVASFLYQCFCHDVTSQLSRGIPSLQHHTFGQVTE